MSYMCHCFLEEAQSRVNPNNYNTRSLVATAMWKPHVVIRCRACHASSTVCFSWWAVMQSLADMAIICAYTHMDTDVANPISLTASLLSHCITSDSPLTLAYLLILSLSLSLSLSLFLSISVSLCLCLSLCLSVCLSV